MLRSLARLASHNGGFVAPKPRVPAPPTREPLAEGEHLLVNQALRLRAHLYALWNENAHAFVHAAPRSQLVALLRMQDASVRLVDATRELPTRAHRSGSAHAHVNVLRRARRDLVGQGPLKDGVWTVSAATHELDTLAQLAYPL